MSGAGSRAGGVTTTLVAGSGGASIAVQSIGEGPGLVILHGAGITTREYRRLAERLADRFRVHLYNRRGRPGGDPLVDDERLETDLADLAAVLGETRARNILGHSGGGFVALQAGFSLPVDRIALYDPAIAITGCNFPRGFVDEFDRLVADGDTVKAVVLMGRNANPDQPGARLPLWLQELVVRGYIRTPIGRRMVDLISTIGPELREIVGHEAPASDYSTIGPLVWLACGSRSSRYFHQTCAALAGALPHAETAVISRASHNTANIAPARFVDPLADFLTATIG